MCLFMTHDLIFNICLAESVLLKNYQLNYHVHLFLQFCLWKEYYYRCAKWNFWNQKYSWQNRILIFTSLFYFLCEIKLSYSNSKMFSFKILKKLKKTANMIEAFVSMVNYLSARKDDDIADRMNYLYTPNILLAFSVLISFKQFGGR